MFLPVNQKYSFQHNMQTFKHSSLLKLQQYIQNLAEISDVMKASLPYKTITSQNVLFERQVKNFFNLKVIFRSRDNQVFIFLFIP